MNRTGLIIALALAGVVGLLFGLFPQLDLAVVRPFYEVADSHHNMFAWRLSAHLMLIHNIALKSGLVLVAPAVIALIGKLILPRRKMLIPGRATLFLIITMALGPGLLVNVVLKDYWGRPRPIDVAQFGGSQHFVAWWDPRGDCPSNCSFVSGDVAVAAWTFAPAALVPPPWRAVAYGAALSLTLGMAAIRMMAGAHFLTDTVFAGIFTFLIVWVAHGLIYRWPRTRLSDRQVARALERFTLGSHDAATWLGHRAADEIAGPEGGDEADPHIKRRRRGWW